MIIISDLKEGEAVEFDGRYLVNFPQGKYVVSGEELTINGYAGRQIMVGTIDDIYRVTQSTPVLTGFTTPEGEPFGSLVEYNELCRQNDEYLDTGYPSIEDEFEIRRKIEKYSKCVRVKSKPVEIKTKVDISLVGSYIDTGSPFIQSALHFGQKTFGHNAGPFRVNLSAVAKNEAQAIQAVYPKLTLSTHSNIRYAQYGSYIFSDNDKLTRPWIEKTDHVVIYKTLEAAEIAEANVRKYVRDSIMLVVDPKPLSHLGATNLELLKLLELSLSSLNKVESMKATRGSFMTGKETLRQAITMLKENSQ